MEVKKTSPPPDFEEIQLPYSIGSERALYSKPENPKGLYLKLFVHKADRNILGEVIFGPLVEGPPGHAHGGVAAFVMDEAMGTACWVSGFQVVAREIRVQFQNMIPQGEKLIVNSGVRTVEEKNVETYGEIRTEEGVICVTGHGRFHILSDEQLEKLKV